MDMMPEYLQKAGARLPVVADQKMDEQSSYFLHDWKLRLPELEDEPESPLSNTSSLDFSPVTMSEDYPTSPATSPDFWREAALMPANPKVASSGRAPALCSEQDADAMLAAASAAVAMRSHADRLSRWDRARRLHQRPTLRSFEESLRHIKERSRKRRRTFTGNEERPLVESSPSDPAEVLELTRKHRSWDNVV